MRNLLMKGKWLVLVGGGTGWAMAEAITARARALRAAPTSIALPYRSGEGMDLSMTKAHSAGSQHTTSQSVQTKIKKREAKRKAAKNEG
jgi:hypothetical protein